MTCPGCGARAEEGLKLDCSHPQGCGLWRGLPKEVTLTLDTGDLTRILLLFDNQLRSMDETFKKMVHPISLFIDYYDRLVKTRNKVWDAWRKP